MNRLAAAVVVLWGSLLAPGVLPAQQPQEKPPRPSQRQATQIYNAAAALFNRHAYDLAAEEWQRFLKAAPDHPRVPHALTYLGICYIHLDKPQLAAETLSQVVRLHGKHKIAEQAWLQLGIARYLAAKGNPQALAQAAQALEQFTRRYPNSRFLDQALYYQAECHLTAKAWAKAVPVLQTLLEKAPQSRLAPGALYNLGVALQEQKRWPQAQAAFSRFLESYPRHQLRAEVQLRRGEVQAALGKHQQAQADFAQAAQEPGFFLADYALLRVADMLAEQKKLAEAAQGYLQVVEKFPRSELASAARLEAGKCYYLAGRLDQAQAVLKQVPQDKQPQAAEAAHWLARCLLKQKQPQEALRVAAAALGKKGVPKSWQAELLMDRGDALYRQPQRKKESIAVYLQLVQQHPQHPLAPDAQYAAALAALETQQLDQAQRLARQFRRRWPDHTLGADALFVLAEALLLAGKHAQAAQSYQQLQAAFPQHPDRPLWLLRHGVAMHLAGDHLQAVKLLNQALEGKLPPQRKAEALHWLGSSYVKQKKYAEALRFLKQARAVEPAWSGLDRTLLLLAFVQAEQKQLRQAAATAEELLQRFPQSPLAAEAYYRLGQYAARSGQRAKALEAYGQVMALWPKSRWVPYALLGRGLLQLDSGRNQAAVQDLDALLKQFPRHELAAQARLGRGLALFNQKQYDQAAEELHRLLQNAPPAALQAQARYYLALCLVEQKKWPEAIEQLRELLQQHQEFPERHKALYELAWAYRSAGEQQKALEAFGRLVREFPTSPLVPEALFHQAEARYQAKNYAEAATLYQQVLQRLEKLQDHPETDPQAARELAEQALHKWAWALYEQKQYQQAAGVLARQLKRFPRGKLAQDARFLAGECTFQQGQQAQKPDLQRNHYEQALQWYQQVEKPSQPSFRQLALLHAAQAANRLEKYDTAARLLDKVEEQLPQAQLLPELLFERAYALHYSGKKEEAVRLYRRIPRLTQREVAARSEFMLGEYYFDKKDHREAIRHYFRAAYGYSYRRWQANALYEAGRCFEVLRKLKQARECYQELIDKFPQSSWVPEARKRLEALEKAQGNKKRESE